MPRPRFQKLAPQKRAELLAIAAEEFGEHGFEGASYNRIIERAGISKGAMYYYFDDKEDLFVTALSDVLQRFIVDVGSVETSTTADEFWREVTRWYRRSLELFRRDAAATALLRSLWKSVQRGSGSGAMAEIRRFGLHHIDRFIENGQRVGAIRSDLPADLLQAVLAGLEESIDVWLLENHVDASDAQVAELAVTLTALYRRVAEPDPQARVSRTRASGRKKPR